MGMMKEIINDLSDTVEDLFLTIIGTALVVFMAGMWYGANLQPPVLYYPLYLFLALLAYKLAKDIVNRTRKKE
jgi:hypothetical protein